MDADVFRETVEVLPMFGCREKGRWISASNVLGDGGTVGKVEKGEIIQIEFISCCDGSGGYSGGERSKARRSAERG